MAEWLPDIRGKFGCEDEKSWPVTIGMNEKGGMDEDEFENTFSVKLLSSIHM